MANEHDFLFPVMFPGHHLYHITSLGSHLARIITNDVPFHGSH